MNIEMMKNIIAEGEVKGHEAFNKYLNENRFGGCGFAWCVISEYEGKKIRGNSKIAKMLNECGIKQNYAREFIVYNHENTQNVEAKLASSGAFAKHLRDNGFRCYPDSRLD